MGTHGILPRGNCVRDRFRLGLVGYNYGVHSHCHVYKVIAGHSGVEVSFRPAPTATCAFFPVTT